MKGYSHAQLSNFTNCNKDDNINKSEVEHTKLKKYLFLGKWAVSYTIRKVL